MKHILIQIFRSIALKTPVISKILLNRRELIAKNQELNIKIDQLYIEYDISQQKLSVLNDCVDEIRALNKCVISQSDEISSLRDLVLDQTVCVRSQSDEISSLRDLVAAQAVDVSYLRRTIQISFEKKNFNSAIDMNIDSNSYDEKLSQELNIFTTDVNVHNLPDIFHYWSNKFLKPMMEEIGCTGVDHFYAKYLFESVSKSSGPYEFVSIGAGNGDVEIQVAKLLIEMGLSDFSIECLEYNPSMIERGRTSSIEQGLNKYISFTQADFNDWKPRKKYCGIMANHSLHHVVNLEGLFDTIKDSLLPNGFFVTGDMIGRNGHQRWPEAMEMVNQFWAELGDDYHYNQQLKRLEPLYIDHDCSSEGFEGIRAQDIMQQLLSRFHFKVFIGFLNVISPFIDRSFGHNFNKNNPVDCLFIDKVHQADEDGFKSGAIKPTQMFAVMSLNTVKDPFYSRGLSPEFSVRDPNL